jgi:hypothetical protein
MNEPHDKQLDHQVRFLRELLEQRASIDGDVLEISKDTWTIHGVIPYDGEVPMAVFDTSNEARHVLDEILGARVADEL